MHDVIVVGGSYAGLSAALQLARARRDVVVVDAGQRRNRFASHAHGLVGRDGQPPEQIAAEGRADVLAYPTVTWRDAEVRAVRAIEGGFAVTLDDGELRGKRVILATGIADDLPAVPGLEERWGKTVFHCPYCHGYELDRGRIGVLARGALSVHQALLVADWGTTTLFVDESFEPDAEQLAALAAREVTIERARVSAIDGAAPRVDVLLADGRRVELDGLFVVPRARLSPLAEQLGCELDEGPLGRFYKTDMMKETTVPGVFACGDVALPMGSVTFAIADGARAGTAAHQSLVFRRDAH